MTGASGTRLGESIHGDGTKTVRYRAESVTDVAWTAWPGFRVESRAVMAAGRPVELELLLPLDEADEAGLYLATAEAALDLFGTWYGPYPWPKLTLVLPPVGAEGAAGMEYPTFATAERSLDLPLGLTLLWREVSQERGGVAGERRRRGTAARVGSGMRV